MASVSNYEENMQSDNEIPENTMRPDQSGERSDNVGDVESDKELEDHSHSHVNPRKTLLTSRRNSVKKVIIAETSGDGDSSINPYVKDTEEAIKRLENSFETGISNIRQTLTSWKDEKHSMERHIKSLEEALIESNTSNKEYKILTQQLMAELKEAKSSLEKCQAINSELRNENTHLQADHSEHLEHIAKHQRQRSVAKRTVNSWKRKIRSREDSVIARLQEENNKLKKDLMAYQEAAKQAFLRSTNTLNSEAVTFFQTAAMRHLHSEFSIDERGGSDQSVSSFQPSGDSKSCDKSDDDDDAEERAHGEDDKENRNYTLGTKSRIQAVATPSSRLLGSTVRKDSLLPGSKGYMRERISFFRDGEGKEQTVSEAEARSAGQKEQHAVVDADSEHSLNTIESRPRVDKGVGPLSRQTRSFINSSKGKSSGHQYGSAIRKAYAVDYIPEQLRRETHQIMQQLQTSKQQPHQEGDLSRICQNRTHIHICHCTSQFGTPKLCQYCTAKQNFNFAMMPLSNGPKDRSALRMKRQTVVTADAESLKKSKNGALYSEACDNESKAQVIYQPSGSTVIIQKHVAK